MTKLFGTKKIIAIIIFIVLVIIIINARTFVIKLMYPKKYSEYVEKYANVYEIDSNLTYAIIKVESNFNEKSISSKGAIGLMQLMEETANEIADELKMVNRDLTNPEININIGVAYLEKLLKKYEYNYNMALVAYNAGIGNVSNWIENGVIQQNGENIENVPYLETNNYVRKILRAYEIYKNK